MCLEGSWTQPSRSHARPRPHRLFLDMRHRSEGTAEEDLEQRSGLCFYKTEEGGNQYAKKT